jgi:carbon-monoxide dehydrogenase small subunit
MKIPLTINTKEVFVDCTPDELLVNVLRAQGFYSVKDTDSTGLSGSSTILLDNKPVPSCLMPAAAARDSNIITLEYFSTLPEYKCIKSEMDAADVKLCGLCNPGKIFTSFDIIVHNYRPLIQDVILRLKDFTCCCVDTAVMANVIIKAAYVYRNSIGKKDAKKF